MDCDSKEIFGSGTNDDEPKYDSDVSNGSSCALDECAADILSGDTPVNLLTELFQGCTPTEYYLYIRFSEYLHVIENILKELLRQISVQNDDEEANKNLSEIFAKLSSDVEKFRTEYEPSLILLNETHAVLIQQGFNKIKDIYADIRTTLYDRTNLSLLSADEDMNDEEVEDIKHWTTVERIREHIVMSRAEVNGKRIELANIKSSIIEIQGNPLSLYMENIRDCLIYCGPCTNTINVRKSYDTTMALACKQLQLMEVRNCQIYAHVTNNITLEHCFEITIGGYSYYYPQYEVDVEASKLDFDCNNNTEVADFSWLIKCVRSPNWSFMANMDSLCWQELRAKTIGFVAKEHILEDY
ncbi:uncharacterized protein LOC119667185 [Teleopsis dalmanni]|uniref:uncharacterized protein LOC119667185 n=1 Tax=Teleopsis dalmanni TaxID=139649 RepID=UPI0018CF1B7B|nr:uncharacterized protein LOC119667185 [Teleopsis dalmanni]